MRIYVFKNRLSNISGEVFSSFFFLGGGWGEGVGVEGKEEKGEEKFLMVKDRSYLDFVPFSL